jgi:hypothetical protein
MFQKLGVDEINETVPNIATVLLIIGQVQKVVGVGVLHVNFLGNVLDGVLVGDVPDHEGGPGVAAYRLNVDVEGHTR